MQGIFTHISAVCLMVNVGKYNIPYMDCLGYIYIYIPSKPYIHHPNWIHGCNDWDKSTYPKVRGLIIVGCFVFVGGVGMENVPGPNA